MTQSIRFLTTLVLLTLMGLLLEATEVLIMMDLLMHLGLSAKRRSSLML